MSNDAKQNSISNFITGRSAFLALLKDEGVTKLFGNPGTTELPIMHAMTQQSDISYVLGLQEAIVVAMADGYARATGEIAAVNVHVAPGLVWAMRLARCIRRIFPALPSLLPPGNRNRAMA